MTSSRLSFKTLLAFAHELADGSGPAILPHFRRPIRVDNKAGDGRFDPVTAADKAAERRIAKAIAARWPDHGLIGEEYGVVNAGAHYRWVVDPIDGTRAFVMGSPLWGTLIGLLEGDTPQLGLMDQPFTGERFWSGGSASYWRGPAGKARRIRSRGCSRIEDAVLTTTHPGLLATAADRNAFRRLEAQARMTRFGGDCYAYCLLAAGFVDCVVESGLKPYDIVALIPIVERAGGCITGWDGGPATAGGRIVAAGDPRLHAWLVEALSG